MEPWGVFVTKQEPNDMLGKILKLGYEIFEVRELTMIEKLTYATDPHLFVNDPHVIMFYATEREYKKLLRKLRLVRVF